MSITKTLTLTTIAAGLVTAAWSHNAHADITTERLKAAQTHGFTHIEKVEYEDNGFVEVEGWGEDGSYLEVKFDGETVVEENRERTNVQPWGISFAQMEQLLAHANDEGIHTVKDIEVEENGQIEVEGRDADDREKKVKVRISDLG